MQASSLGLMTQHPGVRASCHPTFHFAPLFLGLLAQMVLKATKHYQTLDPAYFKPQYQQQASDAEEEVQEGELCLPQVLSQFCT